MGKKATESTESLVAGAEALIGNKSAKGGDSTQQLINDAESLIGEPAQKSNTPIVIWVVGMLLIVAGVVYMMMR